METVHCSGPNVHADPMTSALLGGCCAHLAPEDTQKIKWTRAMLAWIRFMKSLWCCAACCSVVWCGVVCYQVVCWNVEEALLPQFVHVGNSECVYRIASHAAGPMR